MAKVLGIDVPGAHKAAAASLAVAIRRPVNGGPPQFRSELASMSELWNLT